MQRLDPDSLEWALKHALLLGDTDVFPRPFEYEAIQHAWATLGASLANANVLEWKVRPHRTLLSAKARLGFRAVTQLDPLDFLIFAALVREICVDVEARRVPIAAGIVFSYRAKPTPDGRLFDPSIGYGQFVARTSAVIAGPEVAYVAVTDIADFYSRIYHHRLENALSAATAKSGHVRAIMTLLARWNGTVTFGIPVGSAPSRVLAEAALMDVDEALQANQIKYARFNDDFRIFASSYAEAYRSLALLADILYKNHGLSLQKEKTAILPKKDFAARFLMTPAARELQSLRDRLGAIVQALGLDSPYEEIEYDDLDGEQQELIDTLNLQKLLEEELAATEIEYPVVRFVIRRFAQLGDDSAVDLLLNNLDILHPVFPDIIKYLLALRHLEGANRAQLGARLLNLLSDSVVSELAWHRMWALDLFARSASWNHADKFVLLLAQSRDPFVRRKLILALGRAGQRHWFQSQWRSLFDEPAWPRRALLAAASCMPADARKHWYRSVEDRLDELERAVAAWARAHPFSP